MVVVAVVNRMVRGLFQWGCGCADFQRPVGDGPQGDWSPRQRPSQAVAAVLCPVGFVAAGPVVVAVAMLPPALALPGPFARSLHHWAALAFVLAPATLAGLRVPHQLGPYLGVAPLLARHTVATLRPASAYVGLALALGLD